jgi:hypothetical protein
MALERKQRQSFAGASGEQASQSVVKNADRAKTFSASMVRSPCNVTTIGSPSRLASLRA